MDQRNTNTKELTDLLESALAARDPQALWEAAQRARLALDFRDTDAMIGPKPVDSKSVFRLEELMQRALLEASELGLRDAAVALADSALAMADRKTGKRALGALARLSPDDSTGMVRHRLGLLCFNGIGTKKDLERSVDHHRAAAELGHADAMFELYAMLSKGLGVTADPLAAVEWCQHAAKSGNVRAMYSLAAHYATGREVALDVKTAMSWYERAARQGHGRAAATLGVMFASGQGVDRDAERARAWFAQADEMGFDWRLLAAESGVDPDGFDHADTKTTLRLPPKKPSKATSARPSTRHRAKPGKPKRRRVGKKAAVSKQKRPAAKSQRRLASKAKAVKPRHKRRSAKRTTKRRAHR